MGLGAMSMSRYETSKAMGWKLHVDAEIMRRKFRRAYDPSCLAQLDDLDQSTLDGIIQDPQACLSSFC